MRNALWVALGSGLGGAARYATVAAALALFGPAFPVGTLMVNVVGSLLIGVLAGLVRPHGEDPLSPHVRLLLATGFCGGFTTYSFFAYQSLWLVQMGRPVAALAYTLGSPALGLLAVWVGYRLAHGRRA